MTISPRERRLPVLLAVAAAAMLIYNLATRQAEAPAVVAASGQSIAAAERRLSRVREIAATVPGKEQVLQQAQAELAEREKGVLQAATAAQAQMQLLEVARRAAAALPAKIEFGSVELGREVTPLGRDYGEVSLAVNFIAPIEAAVNFLTELTAQPEAISTRDLRILAREDKDKNVSVRVTLAGVVPKRLVPEKKGGL